MCVLKEYLYYLTFAQNARTCPEVFIRDGAFRNLIGGPPARLSPDGT